MSYQLKTSENLHNLGFLKRTEFFSKNWKNRDIRLHQITFDCEVPDCFSALDAKTMEFFIYFDNFGSKEKPFLHKIGVLPANYIQAYKFYTKIELVVLRIMAKHDNTNRLTEAKFTRAISKFCA